MYSTIKKATRWFLFPLVAGAIALAPVNMPTEANASPVETVDCLDCGPSVVYCCADCSVVIQYFKCTMGEPWCGDFQ